MREVADGVWLLKGFPQDLINVYLVGDTLVDAGTRFAKRRIINQLRGRKVALHVVTHAHPDHRGGSHKVCTALNIPLWCGADDADEIERGGVIEPPVAAMKFMLPFMSGGTHPVARRLNEGDTIGEWQVLHVPGHSLGHIALWRERDRVLIAGDVFFNMRGQLSEPSVRLTPNPAENRRSMRKLAALNPKVVCFGHGPPLTDSAKFQAFVERLPQDAA